MRHIKVLKDKKSPIRVSQHQPEELRERRKHLYEVQKQYAQRNIETTLKGTKLIFTKSKSVYKDKIGSRPTAEEIINGEEVKIAITPGKTTEDNGNRFAAHAVPVLVIISLRSGSRVTTEQRTTDPMMTGNTGPGDCC